MSPETRVGQRTPPTLPVLSVPKNYRLQRVCSIYYKARRYKHPRAEGYSHSTSDTGQGANTDKPTGDARPQTCSCVGVLPLPLPDPIYVHWRKDRWAGDLPLGGGPFDSRMERSSDLTGLSCAFRCLCRSFLTWPQLRVERELEDCLPLATSGVCAYLRSPRLHLSTPAPKETAPAALLVQASGWQRGRRSEAVYNVNPTGEVQGLRPPVA